MQEKNVLIIFVKNPTLGKVKTRIAKTVGDQRALEIYHELLNHTHEITQNIPIQKHVFYSDFIDNQDIWQNDVYHKIIQEPNPDLGIRMACAFRDVLRLGAEKAAIIGSDCLELNDEILEDTFKKLLKNEAVIGRVKDGGYYLLGFNFRKIGERCAEVLKAVFYDKQWSHSNVANEAIGAFEKLNLKYDLMPTLTDIDEYEDYLNHKKNVDG